MSDKVYDDENARALGERLEAAPLATYTVLPPIDVKTRAAQADVLLAVLETFEVDSALTADEGGELLRAVHQEHKELEELRKKTKAPALEAGRDIDAFFKTATAPLLKAKGIITAKLSTYQRKVEAENARRVAEAAAAAQAGQREEATQALAQVQCEAPAAGTTQRSALEITITDESKVPRDFLVVDMTKLKAHARAGGDAPPGVQFTRVTKVQVGR